MERRCVCIYIHIYTCIYIYICMYTYIYIGQGGDLLEFLRRSSSIYIYIYDIYIYTYMHTYIHTFIGQAADFSGFLRRSSSRRCSQRRAPALCLFFQKKKGGHQRAAGWEWVGRPGDVHKGERQPYAFFSCAKKKTSKKDAIRDDVALRGSFDSVGEEKEKEKKKEKPARKMPLEMTLPCAVPLTA